MSDGLEFESVRSDGTITQSDIRALGVMPWDPNGCLVLAGCNTGVTGSTRLWCPAQEFALSQHVRTLGMTGFSSFSSNWNTFVKATTSHREIALWAYKKGRNGALGSGLRMPGRMFTP